MTMGLKDQLAKEHVERLLFTVLDCADEVPVHPEENEDSERLAYQAYLLGEALATLLEKTFAESEHYKRESAKALLDAIRKRLDGE